MISYADLFSLRKPGQYVNTEVNALPARTSASVRAVLVFPDLYEMGLPNMGLQILYRLANELEFVSCERAYAPEEDAAALLRARGDTLRSLESRTPLSAFDVVGFTLQSELTYTTVLECLDLGGIPVRRAERDGEELFPLVIAGGPGAMNPAPLSAFIDIFFIGDGESAFRDFLALVRDAREERVTREEFFLEVERRIPSAYVSSHYEERYDADGRLVAIERTAPGNFRPVRALEPSLAGFAFPTAQIVPFVQCAHERAQVEIARGCRRGCRFCQAGFMYRPLREKAADVTVSEAIETLRATGYEELGFVSLSTSDYPVLVDVLDRLMPFCAPRGIGISLPSLRMDSFSVSVAGRLGEVKKAGLTFAPEAGTERLRAVINKNLSQADIEAALDAAFERGWQKIKLYFMIGLPTETEEDRDGIADLAFLTIERARTLLPRQMFNRLSVHVSVSTFVPKAHTPFQWERQMSAAEAQRAIERLRARLRSRHLRVSFHDPEMAEVEGLLARGDRRAGDILYAAWKRGAVFDGWKERFRADIWREVAGPALADALRERSPDDVLPWDIIDARIDRRFLARERERARAARPTPPCRPGCRACGVCSDELEVGEGA